MDFNLFETFFRKIILKSYKIEYYGKNKYFLEYTVEKLEKIQSFCCPKIVPSAYGFMKAVKWKTGKIPIGNIYYSFAMKSCVIVLEQAHNW